LIVGIDIGQESSQICYYDEQQRQPVSVSVVNSVDNRQKYQFGFMLSGANQDNLKELLCTLLALLPKNGRKAGERDNICVTVSDFSKPVLEKLSAAVQLTGYAKENWSFISHEEAYAYYAFSQKKELYVNGAVLLDYREDGLHTHYMTIVKKSGQEMIPEESHVYSSEMICSVPQRRKTLAQAEKELIHCVQDALKDKIVSAVYLTGTGFEAENLPKELTHVLCARRKAFAGQNLFVKGAAYAALKEDTSAGHSSGRLLACRNRITTGLELNIKERGEEKRFRMVRPGTNWYEAGRSVELILEDMRTIPVILHRCDTGHEWTQEIDISAIPFRQGRMTRVAFEVRFDSDSHCVVRIEDMGFGGFVKSSGVVVEEEINLETDKIAQKEE